MRDRCRRQRNRRHPAAADCRAARDPHRVERLPRTARRARRPRGSFIAFARTKAEREAAGDPRPSLAERNGSREAYVVKVEAAAHALVAERPLICVSRAITPPIQRRCLAVRAPWCAWGFGARERELRSFGRAADRSAAPSFDSLAVRRPISRR